jgi:hypothetical protein
MPKSLRLRNLRKKPSTSPEVTGLPVTQRDTDASTQYPKDDMAAEIDGIVAALSLTTSSSTPVQTPCSSQASKRPTTMTERSGNIVMPAISREHVPWHSLEEEQDSFNHPVDRSVSPTSSLAREHGSGSETEMGRTLDSTLMGTGAWTEKFANKKTRRRKQTEWTGNVVSSVTGEESFKAENDLCWCGRPRRSNSLSKFSC